MFHRNCRAYKTGAGSAGCKRNVVVVRVFHDLRDFFGARRTDDDIRPAGRSGQFVMRVFFIDIPVRQEAFFISDNREQVVEILRV